MNLLYVMPSTRQYAYAYVTPPEQPGVVTIEQPPEAAAHEEAGAAPLEQRDPRE